MIQRIRLLNFQCWEKLELDLGPLTVLIGETEAGKSAVIRAIRWIATNRPGGMEYIKHGAEKCSVKLWMDSGDVIERRRSKKTNAYLLNGTEYKAMGQTVPEDIAKALGITPNQFQGQFDAPFWLADSPGQLSKELNRLVNLDVMDRCLANANARMRKASHNVEFVNGRLEEARGNADALKWAGQADKELKAIEHKQALALNLESESEALGELIGRLEHLQTGLQSLSAANAALESIRSKLNRIEEIRAEESELKALLDQLQKNELLENVLQDDLKKIQSQLADVELCPTCFQPIA